MIQRFSSYLISWSGVRFLALAGAVAVILSLIAPPLMNLFSIRPARQAVMVEGRFLPKGNFPGVPIGVYPQPRTWGSWCGDDDTHGKITIGPFPATAKISFYVSGYPSHPGNSVEVINTDTKEVLPVPIQDVAESWLLHTVALPKSWRGAPVVLVATDKGTGPGGWLGVSEPVFCGVATVVFFKTIVVVFVTGLIYMGLVVGGMNFVAHRGWLPPQWHCLGGFAIAALISYPVFWLYFISPMAGHIGAGLAVCASMYMVFRRSSSFGQAVESAPITLVLLVACLYVGVCYAQAPYEEINYLAQARFRHILPTDNMIPGDFGAMLYRGEPAINVCGDWHTSDRPPLQTGWTLITYGIAQMAGVSHGSISATSGLWLQIAWIAAVYGILRSFSLTIVRASAWTVLFSFSGFFILNTTFVWPKLSGAAFTLGLFGLCFLTIKERLRTSHGIFAGLFAVLGWLSHGGVAFSLLPLGVWGLWHLYKHRQWRLWLLAAAVFLVMALPWMGFQKFYAPPGDRLVKWHLGGQIAFDERSALQTIIDAWKRPVDKIISSKLDNLRSQICGEFEQMFDFSHETVLNRRHDEFHFPFRALTWWLLGFPSAVICCLFAKKSGFPVRKYLNFSIWIIASYACWCTLMYEGACIHQGSYAALTGLFIMCCVGLACIHRLVVVPFALLIGVYSGITWWGLPPHPLMFGMPNPGAIAMVVFALVCIGVLVIAAASVHGSSDGSETKAS